MDERFPKWLRTIVRKLDFLALPNLGMLICGLAVLAFLAQKVWDTPLERFIFDPNLVLAGEWWRLFAFPLSSGLSNPIFLLFYVLFTYYILNALESTWGAGPLTVFVLLGYVCALAGAFLTRGPVQIWMYILENVSLAFGTLFPEVEFYLFFVLPVKAKWVTLFFGVMILFEFFTNGPLHMLFLVIVLFPYLLFFTPLLIHRVKTGRFVRKNRQRFDDDMWR